MNIGLGLIAADEYFKEGDRRGVRTDQRDRRAYDQQVRQADLSVLDDRTAATRSGYRDQVAEREARAQTRPGQTANTIKRQGVEGVGLDRAAARQGTVEDTADINADLGLGQAQANQQNQPVKLGLESDKLKVDSAVAAQAVQQLPQKLAQAAASGVIQQRDAQVQLIAGLEPALATNNPQLVQQYVQGAIDTGLFPAAKGAKVAKVGMSPDGQSFVAVGADGKQIFSVSRADIDRLKQMGGKSELKTVNAGDSLVEVRGGKATPVYTAPESEKSRAAKIGPLERDVNYLVSEHGMSKDQALQRLQSAKVKSRPQFIMDMVADKTKANGGSSTPELEAEYSQMYDRINAMSQGQSNPSPAPTMPTDPALRGLLNIPPR